MNPKRLLGAFVLLSASTITQAATPITIGEMVKIPSKVMGEERTLLVSLPDAYVLRANTRFPVLYLTDGDAQIMHTRGTIDFLARNGLMPNMIVVGVTNTDRARDLTPSRADFANPDGTVTKFSTSGGADRSWISSKRKSFRTSRRITARCRSGSSAGTPSEASSRSTLF